MTKAERARLWKWLNAKGITLIWMVQVVFISVPLMATFGSDGDFGEMNSSTVVLVWLIGPYVFFFGGWALLSLAIKGVKSANAALIKARKIEQ